MSQYALDTSVNVYPFTRQVDGEEVVIGRPDTMAFLALPIDAVEILDYLAAGKTVGEVQGLYQQKYGEVPDLVDFLSLLEDEGFVQPKKDHSIEPLAAAIESTSTPRSAASPDLQFHFANFPQSVAKLFFKRSSLILYALVITLALVATFIEPSIIPGRNAYVFTKNMTVMILSLTIVIYITVFLHEMAHLVGARAVGVPSRFSIGHRLWVLVAETDMTGIWVVPRNQRYLPFLAGSLLDAISASVLILMFFAVKQGWLSLPSIILSLANALLLSYLLRILWQCYFFVQTDFYYVITTYFNCKNLMGDTQIFLQNKVARFVHWVYPVDQSKIPANEMRVIRSYALVWIGGRVVALSILIFVSLPVMYHYLLTVFFTLRAGYSANPYAFIDALMLGSLFLVLQGSGFWLWFRSLYRGGRKTYELAKRSGY